MTVPFRSLAVLAAAFALAVAPASPALAHVGDGPQPSDYSGVITSIDPSLFGVQVSVSSDGELLRATVTGDGELLVPGYSEEPYLRISADGVQRNTRSPATYLNVTVGGDTELPSEADPLAEPEWVTVASEGSFQWHDHRTHWMGAQPPAETVVEPDRSHLISTWSIPLSYDGRSMTVEGTLTWTPPPSSLPATVAIVGLAVTGVALAGRARWQRPMAGLVMLLVGAEVLHLVLAPLPDQSPVFGVIAGSLPTLVAAGLAWVSWRSARAGTATVAYTAGIAAWLILAQGLSDVSVLWNSQLPAVGPDWLTRGSVVVTVGLGAGVALGSLRVLLHRRGERVGVPAVPG